MRKYLFFLAVVVFIATCIIYYQKDTINSNFTNQTSGFYQKPFNLVLTTENNYKIHYTLDGSKPTNESEMFLAPLLITGNESYSYLSFINTTIADSIKNFGWKEPKGKQDKATIVKYASFQDGILQTKIKTLSFYV